MLQKPSWVKQRRHLYQMPSWSSVKKSIIRKHLQRPAFSSHPDFTVGSGFKTDWLSLAGYTAGRDHSSRRNMSVFFQTGLNRLFVFLIYVFILLHWRRTCNILRGNDINSRSCHIRHDHIPDPHRCFHFHSF